MPIYTSPSPLTDLSNHIHAGCDWLSDLRLLKGAERQQALEMATKHFDQAEGILANLPASTYGPTLAEFSRLVAPIRSQDTGSRFMYVRVRELIKERHGLALRREQEHHPHSAAA